MIRPALLVAAVVALTACGGGEPGAPAGPTVAAQARITGTEQVSARVRDLTVESPALGRSAVVRLLLPPRFAAEPSRRWPVLYLLHGCCDTYESWTDKSDVERFTATSDVLVVIPEGGRAGFYSDWLDGPKWETFHLEELRRLLEADYRAGDRRAIAGVSMGGLGALAYAARHPGMFRAAASFSGVVHTRIDADAPERYRGLLRGEGEDEDGLWGDPAERADVWAAHNPYDLAAKLRGTALFVSCGDGQNFETGVSDPNEVVLRRENAAFAARLRELGVPARIDLYGPGTHSWPFWQRELRRAWPTLRAGLGLR